MRLKPLIYSRFFFVILLITALALLVLALNHLGGDLPPRAEVKRQNNPSDFTNVVEKIEGLFATETLIALRPATNTVSPFYTTHFQPPPAPAPEPVAPAPPPSTTKKVSVVYQGVYETAAGDKKAFVKVDQQLVVGNIGTKVVADWTVDTIDRRTLTLKNAVSETNIFQFNVPKEVEIPIQ